MIARDFKEPTEELPRGARLVQVYEIGDYDQLRVHAIATIEVTAADAPWAYRNSTLFGEGPPRPATAVFRAKAFCGRIDTVRSFGLVAPREVTCEYCADAVAPSWKRRLNGWRDRVLGVRARVLDALRPAPAPVEEPVDSRWEMAFKMIQNLYAEFENLRNEIREPIENEGDEDDEDSATES